MIRLQELRQEKSISQAELAKALGLTQQSYSRYERGVCELSYNALIKLARYFDVSVDYLLGNSTFYYPDNLQSTDPAPALSDKEHELVRIFRTLSSSLQDTALDTVRVLAGLPTESGLRKKA